MKPIPIGVARNIAEQYGYDQVVIYARKVDRLAGVGETDSDAIKGGEHMTTYGRTVTHCNIAARIGKTLQKFMGWDTAEEAK